MKIAAAVMLWFLMAQTAAMADVLKLKTGETKTGRILAESEGQVLFQEMDGTVSELRSSAISIMDRSDVSGNGGRVSFFTNSPRKKKKVVAPEKPSLLLTFPGSKPLDPSASQAPSDEGVRDATFENLDKILQVWLEKHPEAQEWLEKAADKAIKNSAQLDELVAQAKKGAS